MQYIVCAHSGVHASYRSTLSHAHNFGCGSDISSRYAQSWNGLPDVQDTFADTHAIHTDIGTETYTMTGTEIATEMKAETAAETAAETCTVHVHGSMCVQQ